MFTFENYHKVWFLNDKEGFTSIKHYKLFLKLWRQCLTLIHALFLIAPIVTRGGKLVLCLSDTSRILILKSSALFTTKLHLHPTIACLVELVISHLKIGRGGVISWPPCSPDGIVMDF